MCLRPERASCLEIVMASETVALLGELVYWWAERKGDLTAVPLAVARAVRSAPLFPLYCLLWTEPQAQRAVRWVADWVA